MSVEQMLCRALPGTRRAVKDHIRRGKQITAAIAEHWGMDHPHRWRWKHVHWYLNEATSHFSAATRYDHWRTIRALLAVMGRLEDWEPRLRGPWFYKTGARGRGTAGRPPKLPTN